MRGIAVAAILVDVNERDKPSEIDIKLEMSVCAIFAETTQTGIAPFTEGISSLCYKEIE